MDFKENNYQMYIDGALAVEHNDFGDFDFFEQVEKELARKMRGFCEKEIFVEIYENDVLMQKYHFELNFNEKKDDFEYTFFNDLER